jgi:hypothetical protein
MLPDVLRYDPTRQASFPDSGRTLTADTWFILGPKDIISFTGQRQGREQVAQFIATLAETQEAEQFELRDFVAQGDKVVALGH